MTKNKQKVIVGNSGVGKWMLSYALDKGVKFHGNLLHLLQFKIPVVSLHIVFPSEAQKNKKVCQGWALALLLIVNFGNNLNVHSVTLPVLSGHLLSGGDLIMGSVVET